MLVSVASQPWSGIWFEAAREEYARARNAGSAFVLVTHANLMAPPGKLSLEEEARCGRYRLDVDRRSFRLGRLATRYLTRCDDPPVPWSISRDGKPSMEGAPPFNIAHSNGIVLVGWCFSGDLGLDVEVLLLSEAIDPLLEHVCHPEERSFIQELDKTRRHRAFLKCWTRKEALIKADGRGLNQDVRAIDVNLCSPRPIVRVRSTWRVWDLPLSVENASAAMAISIGVSAVLMFDAVSGRAGVIEISNGHDRVCPVDADQLASS